MNEKTMVVTGAFATHTTRLYNYYVCPRNWKIDNLKYIAVNYLNQLQYLGKVDRGPIEWSYDIKSEHIVFTNNNYLSREIYNDLEQFKTLLNHGNHYLFILKPMIGGSDNLNLSYQGTGAFTQSHRYFDRLGEMLSIHQGLTSTPNAGVENNEMPTAINDKEITI